MSIAERAQPVCAPSVPGGLHVWVLTYVRPARPRGSMDLRAGALEFRLASGFDRTNRMAYEMSSRMASEAVASIRTVVSLGLADTVLDEYGALLRGPIKSINRRAVIAGASYGFSQAIIFFNWSLAFYYGALLVNWGLAAFNQIMTAISAIILSGACPLPRRAASSEEGQADIHSWRCLRGLLGAVLHVDRARLAVHPNRDEHRTEYATRPRLFEGASVCGDHL